MLAEAVEGEDIGDVIEVLLQVGDEVADEGQREPAPVAGQQAWRKVKVLPVPGPATISFLSAFELTIRSVAAVRSRAISSNLSLTIEEILLPPETTVNARPSSSVAAVATHA